MIGGVLGGAEVDLQQLVEQVRQVLLRLWSYHVFRNFGKLVDHLKLKQDLKRVEDLEVHVAYHFPEKELPLHVLAYFLIVQHLLNVVLKLVGDRQDQVHFLGQEVEHVEFDPFADLSEIEVHEQLLVSASEDDWVKQTLEQAINELRTLEEL